ncbi:hypothetical protein [Kitasatospora cineracea]|uniref:hypothetical protein n=1 Tax=Kitasatospora cineracea TaxID=88074 RepID=UPI0011CDB7AB|nr:hypothetical protein [Kitasatospora cineracea]
MSATSRSSSAPVTSGLSSWTDAAPSPRRNVNHPPATSRSAAAASSGTRADCSSRRRVAPSRHLGRARPPGVGGTSVGTAAAPCSRRRLRRLPAGQDQATGPAGGQDRDELYARRPLPEDFPDEQTRADAHDGRIQECRDFEEEKAAGAVVAREHGCGFAALPVITGPPAGPPRWDGRAACTLIVPLSLDHSGSTQPIAFGERIGRNCYGLLPPDRGRRPGGARRIGTPTG